MIEYENLQRVNAMAGRELEAAFNRVSARGWYVLGEEVAEFEMAFAGFCGAPFCAGVGNGFDALVMALRAFRFPPGSEVIVPANTYIASVLAVLHAGLHPVLAEPALDTYNLDPGAAAEKIGPRTVAIMPVHLYGKCCDMDSLLALATRHGLRVVEDCAHAHGATFRMRRAGSFGDFGAFSFYPTKLLGALGDGGALTTRDPDLDARIRMYRNYGSRQKYHNEVAGVNSRLDEVQAAFLGVKLKLLERVIDHKRTLASLYREGLKADFILPVDDPLYGDVHHIFPVRHPRRNDLRAYLQRQGIGTEIHYPIPPYRQKALAGVVDNASYPVSDEIHSTVLSLPVSVIHTAGDVERVIDAMNRF